MRKRTPFAPTLLTIAALGFVASPVHAGDADEQAVKAQLQEYKSAAQSFGKTLKGELQAAMKEGGPTAGVKVCHERAPEIAADLSEETGFTLRRTSLKPRATEPTDWERAVLEQFEARKADGTPVSKIAWHEVKKVDGEKELRFMKAIPTEGVCLACHGENIDSELKAEIDRLYPDDQATGFKEGDIRGAISISAALDD